MGVKIALISDVHFGDKSRQKDLSVPGIPNIIKTNEVNMIEDLVKKLNEVNVDYIFIAGDLTSVGSPQEFYYCEQKILEIASRCNVPIENIIVSLGNHDLDWGVTELHRKYKNTDPNVINYTKSSYLKIASLSPKLSLENLFDNFDELGYQPFSGVVEKSDFIVFVINSGFECTKDQSYGKLRDEQLSWLESKLDYYKDESKWKIVLLHHHPFDYPYPRPFRDVSKLSEGAEFQSVVGKGGVNLVIHGHRHHPNAKTAIETGWSNFVTYICCGSLSVNSLYRNHGEIPNVFHVIELYNEAKELDLFSYQFCGFNGWIDVEHNKNTPLDKKMRLGKYYDRAVIQSSISSLPIMKEMNLEKMEGPLMFLRQNEVVELLNSTFGSRVVFKNEHEFIIKEDL